MDFYGILGIPKDADQETIRSAYRILARRYHPDRGAGSSTEKFRQIADAYETLIDPERRQGYDLSLPSARRPAAVPIEPLITTSEPLQQEHPSVYGRYNSAPGAISLRSLEAEEDDDVFFGPWWRW